MNSRPPGPDRGQITGFLFHPELLNQVSEKEEAESGSLALNCRRRTQPDKAR